MPEGGIARTGHAVAECGKDGEQLGIAYPAPEPLPPKPTTNENPPQGYAWRRVSFQQR